MSQSKPILKHNTDVRSSGRFLFLFFPQEGEIFIQPQKSDPSVKILVVCTTGLSSSLYASMLEKEAAARGLPWTFSGASPCQVQQMEKKARIILLAPQVASLRSTLERRWNRSAHWAAFEQPALLTLENQVYAGTDLMAVLERIHTVLQGV